MKALFAAAFLSLVSLDATASTLAVHIFKSDDAPVSMGNRVPAGLDITVYSLDAMKKVDDLLGERLEEEIRKPEYQGIPAGKNRYMKALQHVINSPEWSVYYDQYKDGLRPIEQSIRYRIKKLPAFVFDNKYIVYGVPSFREALSIYQRKAR